MANVTELFKAKLDKVTPIPGPPGPPGQEGPQGPSGSQTPWTTDIDAGGHKLGNVSQVSTDLVASTGLNLYGNSTLAAYINLGAAGFLNRWSLLLLNAESGGNAGSDLLLSRYDDAGNYLGSPLVVNRASGQVQVGVGGMVVAGDVNITGQYRVNNVPISTGGGTWKNMVTDYGCVGDGVTDNATAVSNALAAALASGGQVLYFPPGTYLISSQIVIPSAAPTLVEPLGRMSAEQGALPEATAAVNLQMPTIRLTGAGGSFKGQSEAPTGGTILKLSYSGANGKILSLAKGSLEIDHLTLQETDAATTTPFIYVTSTTVNIHDCRFEGHSSKINTTCDQDAIILGGTTTNTGTGAIDDAFQGYSALIHDNFFGRIRRAVYGRIFANALQISHNSIWTTCGSNLPGGAAIEFDGLANENQGSTVMGNVVEMVGYPYGIRLTYSGNNTFLGNSFWDPTPGTSIAAYYVASSAGNQLIVDNLFNGGLLPVDGRPDFAQLIQCGAITWRGDATFKGNAFFAQSVRVDGSQGGVIWSTGGDPAGALGARMVMWDGQTVTLDRGTARQFVNLRFGLNYSVRPYIHASGTIVLSATDDPNSVIDNLSATAPVTISLPAYDTAVHGLEYTFCVIAAFPMKIQTTDGFGTIQVGATNATSVTCSTVGATLTLVYSAINHVWMATAAVGGWVTESPAATEMPRSNLLAEYVMDGGAGSYVNNRLYPNQPSNNLVGPSEQAFGASTSWGNSSNVTITDLFAPNRNGDWTASRLVAPAGGSGYMASQFPSYITGQQYTISIWVMSNTGATQKVRMGDDSFASSSDITIPASGWTRISRAFAGASGAGYIVPVGQGSALDALDLLIDAAQLEYGPHPTTYVAQLYHMVLGGNPTNTANRPSWTPAGLDFTAGTGRCYAEAFGWSPLNVTAVTIYAVVRANATPVQAGYLPILTDPYSVNNLHLAGDFGTGGIHFKVSNRQLGAAININDSQWHILAGSYDGTNMAIYLDGVAVATSAPGPIAPLQLNHLLLSNTNDSAYWPGQMGYVSMYSAGHSAAQVTANTAILRSMMAGRGVTIP